MLSCNGCKNRNTYTCECCFVWSRYESDILINPVLALNKMFGVESSERRENNMTIKKVYFNDPVTVVLWEDGTKTIVKSGEDDIYDPEKGLAMAIAKKALGNKGNYYEVFKKWLPEEAEIKELPESLKKLIDENIIKEDELLKWLTPEELAEKLGCTKATIQKQCREDQHPGAKKVGGKWKIPYKK